MPDHNGGPSRWAILGTIEQLDPERDHQRIVHLSFGYEFPWDSIRALEIALYVLSTFICEPVRWIDAFGWRKTCLNERLGYYYFWREVGKRMGIADIPASYDAFEGWSRAYEREHFRFAESNRRVGGSTRDLFTTWVPRAFTPMVRYGIYAMLDDDMIAAFGFPKPLPLTRTILRRALEARGRALRWFPPRREPHFFTDDRNRTHPDGYRIAELGPRRLIAADERRRERQ